MNVRRSRWSVTTGLLAAVTVIAAACGGGDSTGTAGDTDLPGSDDASQVNGEPGEDLSGEVVVSGSSTVEPISARNAEKFNQLAPNVAISVDGPGTGDGFEIFCEGESDISDASRPIAPAEIEKCEANGIEFVELKVAIDGLSVVTSNDNESVDCLSFLDLYALLGPESLGFETWADADELAAELEGEMGAEFGASHAPYPDAPLVITAPGEESGTFDSFNEIVLEGIAEARGEEPLPRPDYQASPNDNVIIEGISGTASSLGWVGYAFVQANSQAVRALAVDGGDGCAEPNPDTIASGEFPIARPLFVYVSADRATEKPEVEAFVDFYMGEEGFASVTEVGYVALEDDVVEETRQVWEDREVGTREA